MSLKYGVGEAHDNFNLDGVNNVPRKFFIFPKSKRNRKSREIFQLKCERKEATDKTKANFSAGRAQTYILKEEWAVEPFNFSQSSQHTTETSIVHNHDDLKIHPSSAGGKERFRMRKVNENGTLRGVIDDFRNGNEHQKHLKLPSNGKYLKCSRSSSVVTATSVASLSGNEEDNDDSIAVTDKTKRIAEISETSESSSFENGKMKFPVIPKINIVENEF